MFNLRNLFKKKDMCEDESFSAALDLIDKPTAEYKSAKAMILAGNKSKPNSHSKVKYKKPQRQMTKKMKKVLENPKKKGV